jgi:hypothetical protein
VRKENLRTTGLQKEKAAKEAKVKLRHSEIANLNSLVPAACHCGIIGHMARECYKRQQGTKPVTVKQLHTNVDSPDDPSQRPALIEFQQFPTFVKRKLEGTNYHEPDEASNSNQDNDSHLNTNATADTSTVDDDEENDASTWGIKTDTTSRDSQHAWEANPRQNKLDTTPQTSMPIGQDNVPIATATSAPNECMAHSFAMSVAFS